MSSSRKNRSKAKRDFYDKPCECSTRYPITHSSRIFATSHQPAPKDPHAPELECRKDSTKSSSIHGPSKVKSCCVHGKQCSIGDLLLNRSTLIVSSSHHSHHQPTRKLKNKDNGFIGKHVHDNSYSCYVKSRTPAPKLEQALEKVRIDQTCGSKTSSLKFKTRWPLAELMVNATNNKDETSVNFYDYYLDDMDQGDTLGRRKNKKQKAYEKYPKLESVLEDNGYIECKVSTSTSESSLPRSLGRRKDKKPRKTKRALKNFPYADMGFLKSDGRSVRTSSSKTPSTTNPFE